MLTYMLWQIQRQKTKNGRIHKRHLAKNVESNNQPKESFILTLMTFPNSTYSTLYFKYGMNLQTLGFKMWIATINLLKMSNIKYWPKDKWAYKHLKKIVSQRKKPCFSYSLQVWWVYTKNYKIERVLEKYCGVVAIVWRAKAKEM